MQKRTAFGHLLLPGQWARVQQQLNVPFIMKVSIGVIMSMLLSAQLLIARTGFGQPMDEKQITLELRDVSLRNALNKVEKLSGYKMAYILQQVSRYKNINLEKDTRSVAATLQLILAATQLNFKQDNNTILIFKKIKAGDAAIAGLEEDVPPTKEIHGRVTNEKGEPVAGVSVYVKGTPAVGTVTNDQGTFNLEVPDNAGILVFSSVTTESLELPIAGKTEINASLRIKTVQQEEVVVVGYGTQKKSDLTGSVTSLKSSDLTLGGTVSNAAQALQGKAAGVLVTQNSKAPGGSISVRIRGANSISSTNEPLYVVDGFPTSNGSDINPNDIASIEILKDASATAIYGARAANGVILITTKRGKNGKSQVSYNGYTGTQKIINDFNMLNGQQYMLLANELYQEIDGQQGQQNAVYTQSQLASTINTDWIKETTRSGIVQSHNVQYEGGNDKTKILTSLGYFKQKGVLENTDFSRISARVNVDQKINDYIRAGASVYGQRSNSNIQDYSGNILQQNVLLGILTYDPTVPVYNADGSFGRPPGGKGDNPVANLLGRQNELRKDWLNGNTYLEIKPIPELTGRVNAGVEISHNFTGRYLPRSTYQGGIDNGVASTNDATGIHQLIDATVNYTKTLHDDHSFSILGGYAYEKTVFEARKIDVKGFSTDLFSFNNLGAASTITGVSSSKSENILISFFGRLNYSYLDKYLLTFTLRRDGSSRFGKDYQWGSFPSGAFAWRLDKEDFIRHLDLFSSLKLRLGYGKTGNDQIGNYASLALISNTRVSFDGSTNTAGTHLNQSTPENSALKWETTSQYNAGLDMGFFDARLLVTVDGYYKKTSDLLIRKSLPLYSGFTSGLSNVGSVENKGFEVEITTRNMVRVFRWDTRLNFAVNRNKVLDIGGGGDITITSSKPIGNVSEEQFAVIRKGEPLGSLYGYVYDGVMQTGETYAPQPNAKPGDPKFKDISGADGKPDGKIDNFDRTIIGSANPKFIYGVTNTFNYKNFDLSIFLHGSVGNKLLNMTRMNLEWNRTSESLNRWTTTHTNTDIPRNGFYYSKYGGYVNSHFIENASFLRMRNITLGYTVPANSKVFQSLRVYGTVENLFTITKYTGWDPEVDTKGYESNSTGGQTANAGAGLDFNSYPGMRSITFGVNLNF
ncbi:MAG TPA: TonB-dependent receptor [Chitinophagaceae bacterium]|nr:TonB-dependent receptor [Chitinophagaceae bacterium]